MLIFFLKEISMSFMTNAKRFIQREAPMLLTAAGVAGFFSGAVMTAKAAVEADRANTRYWNKYRKDLLTKREAMVQTVKIKAPYFAPALGVMIMSTAVVLASSNMSKRRYKALSSLYFTTLTYTENLKSAIKSSVSNSKSEEILDKAQEPTKKAPVLYISSEETLCWDEYSKRYFLSPGLERIRGIMNDLNHTMYTEGWVSLNDYYWEIGLEPIEYGEEIGWAVERGPLEARFGTALMDNRPCVTISFEVMPKHIYTRLGRGQ